MTKKRARQTQMESTVDLDMSGKLRAHQKMDEIQGGHVLLLFFVSFCFFITHVYQYLKGGAQLLPAGVPPFC